MDKKPEIQLTTLSTHSCKSLSQKSTLQYIIGKDAEGDIWLKMTDNSGGGYFNAEPVSMDAISGLLSKLSPKQNISSLYFGRLFTGSSSNSSGFLLACLKDQGLIIKVEGKARMHQLADDYQQKIQAMATASKQNTANTAAKKTVSKTPRKKAARKPRSLLNSC